MADTQPAPSDKKSDAQPLSSPQEKAQARRDESNNIQKPVLPVEPVHDIQYEVEDQDPRFGWTLWMGILTLIAWFALITYLAIYVIDIPGTYKSFDLADWVAITALVFIPLITVSIGTYALRQLAKISTLSHKLEIVGRELTTPDQTLKGKSSTLAAAIAAQVDQVNARLGNALAQMSGFEQLIGEQAEKIIALNADSEKSSEGIAQSLGRQTEALDQMAGKFDHHMGDLSKMLEFQSGKLSTASDYAEQKIKEAKISVEAAASKINTASDVVRGNIVQASASLSASHHDIQSLGEIIKERSEELDGVYKKHAAELTAMIEQLRDEQQVLGANLEERLRKMRDLSLSAQTSAESLIRASHAGKETIEALAQSANLTDDAVRARFKEMEDMVRYSSEHARGISDMAASRVRDSLELTRKEILRIEHDMADLQARINAKSHKSLEMVAEDEPEEHLGGKPEHAADKPRKRRLKLKPILDPTPKKTTPELEIPKYQDRTEDDDIFDDLPRDDEGIQNELPLEIDETADFDGLKRPAADDTPPSSQTKRRFSLSNLFGGKSDTTDASLSIASPAPQSPTPPPTEDAPLPNIVKDLTHLGLAPTMIVDDGCIIEAANSRSARGHEDMSRVVITRLKGPVEHLAKALAKDDGLSARVIAFATRFDRSVENIANNREAIRTHLETEEGRCYLLCDAGLNFGRV